MSGFCNQAFDLTGGAAGIGLACASLLVERGARVALLDRDPAVVAVAAGLGAEHLGIAVDLSQIDQVQHSVDRVFAHFQRLDYLINSAGVALLDKAIDVSESAWDTTLDINLKASFFVAQAWAGGAGEPTKWQIPAGRFARQEEIAGLALYLLSDAAQMITGANMVIDG